MPLIWVFPAAAHDVVGSGGLRPFVRDGALVGVWTTWGVVRATDAGWERVCEEANPGLRDVWLRGDGSVVLARADGLAESVDGGCSSVPLAVHDPAGLIAHAGGWWWVVVDRPGGDALLASDDELRSVVEVPTPPGLDLRSVAADAAGAPWGAGVDAAGAPALFGPSGPVELPELTAAAVVVHGPDPDGAGVVVSTVEPSGRATLWTGPPWVRWVELPAPATGWGCVGDRCVVALDRTGAYGFDRSAPVLAAVDAPAACLVADGGSLWACGAPGEAVQIARSTDGSSFSPALDVADIADASCGGCPTLDTAVEPPPALEGPPAAPRGCGGCRGGAAVVGLLGWRRRGAVRQSQSPDGR